MSEDRGLRLKDGYDDRCRQDDVKGGDGTSANVQLIACVLVCVFTVHRVYCS